MAQTEIRRKTTVLVVDDQPNVRALLGDYLAEVGYRVLLADSGSTALASVRRTPPDVVLLDIMMPHMDGFTFLREFRKDSRAPVILLTARLAEADKVAGLDLGADDYVTKPFGMRELVARIRAVQRRVPAVDPAPSMVTSADIVLDRQRRTVTVAGHAACLTPTEFDLLALMMVSPGRVFRRRELLEHIQGPLAAGVPRTVDVHIRNLRKKIEPHAAMPRYVLTDYGVGYHFRTDAGERGPEASAVSSAERA